LARQRKPSNEDTRGRQMASNRLYRDVNDFDSRFTPSTFEHWQTGLPTARRPRPPWRCDLICRSCLLARTSRLLSPPATTMQSRSRRVLPAQENIAAVGDDLGPVFGAFASSRHGLRPLGVCAVGSGLGWSHARIPVRAERGEGKGGRSDPTGRSRPTYVNATPNKDDDRRLESHAERGRVELASVRDVYGTQ